MAPSTTKASPSPARSQKQLQKEVRKQEQSPSLKKICVLGYAEETRELVHLLGPDVEIWGINMAHHFLFKPNGEQRTKAKVAQWFQLHPREWRGQGVNETGNYGRPKEHVDFLSSFAKKGGTVWLQQPDERIPDAKVYPFGEMFVKAGREYATSSFAYQLAMLWYQIKVEKREIDELYIYGINLTAMDEYSHQKPCVEYWLGRVEELGVHLVIPAASSLLKGPLYARGGSEDNMMEHAKERIDHHRNRYFIESSNVTTAAAMQVEVQHWNGFFNELAKKYPETFVENEELRDLIQERLSKRQNLHSTNMERSKENALNANGMVVDNQHWLSMVGGHDNRGGILPALRYPNPDLAKDVSIPDQTAI